jgi:hypothetical protein
MTAAWLSARVMNKIVRWVRQRTDACWSGRTHWGMNHLSRVSSMTEGLAVPAGWQRRARPSVLASVKKAVRRLLPDLGKIEDERHGARTDEDMVMHSPCL